jgi:hypothetical protein
MGGTYWIYLRQAMRIDSFDLFVIHVESNHDIILRIKFTVFPGASDSVAGNGRALVLDRHWPTPRIGVFLPCFGKVFRQLVTITPAPASDSPSRRLNFHGCRHDRLKLLHPGIRARLRRRLDSAELDPIREHQQQEYPENGKADRQQCYSWSRSVRLLKSFCDLSLRICVLFVDPFALPVVLTGQWIFQQISVFRSEGPR